MVSAGVPIRMPEVYQAPFGSCGIALRLVTMPRVEQRLLGLAAGEAERVHVDQHQVVVGAAGDQRGAAPQQALGQRLALSTIRWA